jgi:hypothetical protein
LDQSSPVFKKSNLQVKENTALTPLDSVLGVRPFEQNFNAKEKDK